MCIRDRYENEYVHCFYGLHDHSNDIQEFNRTEVAEVKWVPFNEIERQIKTDPDAYSAWFKIYMDEHRHLFNEIVGP